eukprot:Skav226199  [mRNA]  locus=scaffold2208:181236:185744:- [translate_table: standard]
MGREPQYVEAMELLRDFDFSSAALKDDQDCNLMIACQWNDDIQAIEATLWDPEGLKLTSFMSDVLTMPADQLTTTKIRIRGLGFEGLPLDHERIWIFNVRYTKDEQGPVLLMHESTTWAKIPDGKEKEALTVIELCSGGFAGWSMAWKTLQPRMAKKVNILAIDESIEACRTYAISHKAVLVPQESMIQPTDFQTKGNQIIWHADLWDDRLLASIAKLQPDMATISAPCPAWSGAFTACGLHRGDGLLLLRAILMCRPWRPKVIAVEQVSNFNTHEHKPFILRAIQFMGYRLLGQRVLNLSRHSPTSRCRWLAILVRVQVSESLPLDPWPATTVNMTPTVMKFAEEVLARLSMTEQVKQTASNPKFVKGAGNKTPAEVLQDRIYRHDELLPCFMAQYGNQHNLSEQTLEKYGYFGHFVAMDESKQSARFWHPAEVAAIHGIMEQYWVDADFPTSWLLTGNCIGTAHALFLVCNALKHFGIETKIEEAFRHFHETKLNVDRCELHPGHKGHMLRNKDDPLQDQHKQSIRQLYDQTAPSTEHWWSYDNGWTNQQLPSQDTQLVATVPMFGYYEGFLCFDGGRQQFWFNTELAAGEIEAHWQGAFCAVKEEGNTNGFKLIGHQYGGDFAIRPNESVFVITRCDASIVKADLTKQYATQLQMAEFGQIFDQFGPITEERKPAPMDVLTAEAWKYETPKLKLVPLTKALMTTKSFWSWNEKSDIIEVKIRGPAEDLQITKEFWANLIPTDTLNLLGRTVNVTDDTIAFHSLTTKVACPNYPFRMGIAIQAARAMFALCKFPNVNQSYPVKLKIFGQVLWEGILPEIMTIDVVKTILKLAMQPVTMNREYRIVIMGKQICDATIGELFRDGKHKLVLHAIGMMRGGGDASANKGSKQQQKQMMQSTLATTLLEQGYPLEWTKATVDTIAWKYGLPRLQAVCAQAKGPSRLREIMALCKEQSIQLPELPKPSNQSTTKGAPWQANKKRKETNQIIDPKDYKIIEGFFFNSDDSAIEVIPAVKPQATGICILTAMQAQQWINSDQLLSSDELAIIALGPVQPNHRLHATHVTFPAMNPSQQKVLLHGTMVQLGAKHAKHKQGSQNITEEKCTIMSVTLFKEDWNEQDWQQITHNPAGFIRRTLQQDNQEKAIQSIWGKSLRAGKAPASPAQATSCQMHCTIMDPMVKPLLGKSGYNGLFFIPKTAQGKIQPDYRIIWCEGDLPHVTGVSSRSAHSLGLVRNGRGKGYGIRVCKEHFQEAWTSMFPGQSAPELKEGDRTFKVQNLVFGTTKTMLEEWLKQLKWEATAHRPLGPQCWIIKSNQAPPDVIHMFNTSPVLITEMKERAPKQDRVILGPAHVNTSDPWQTGAGQDPWANFQPGVASGTVVNHSTSAPTARAATGPIEAKFQEQEAKILALQSNVEALTKGQKENHETVVGQIDRVEKQQQQQGIQMHSALKQIQSDLDKNIHKTLVQHTKAVDSKFDELKRLFIATQKRDKPSTDDDLRACQHYQ